MMVHAGMVMVNSGFSLNLTAGSPLERKRGREEKEEEWREEEEHCGFLYLPLS